MKVVERDLNIYEQFLVAMETSKANGKRISEVSFTDAEYQDFYQLAMTELPLQSIQDLMTRKHILGIKLTVEEGKKAKK